MSAWLWLLLAAVVVLPVFAAFIEDRPPRNEIAHEQGDDEDPGPAVVHAAA